MMKFKNLINCIDTHTGGEATRIVTSGFPKIPGKTILEKRKYVLENYDYLRKMIMLEPRGHSGMYGCILCEPVTEDGDFAVLFTHNEGLSSMCGHATIGLTKTAFEVGMLQGKEGENLVKIDAPCGRVESKAYIKNGVVEKVSFQNVPCFVYKENIEVEVDGIGTVVGDIAYCGAFYVYIDVTKVNLSVISEDADLLVKIGMEIKHKVMDKHEFNHPTEPGINWLYGTIFYEPVVDEGDKVLTKNVCIFAQGQIDRSPTGSGTGGRVAIHYAKGELNKDQILINKSIIDTPMEGKVISETKVGDYNAVITEVSGVSHIMGFNQLVLDPKDPLPQGFRISGN
ncbi:proline racemase family protein [Clostridium sp. CCUG 7971]|uniref:proline racemase family protein n=1 Tax=Clostridium sp. CCUG 7971 TaxID=2811414 RepID=UPI0025712C99|nr:proline racemase family protein [Clostridium sp. CCUG 7971]